MNRWEESDNCSAANYSAGGQVPARGAAGRIPVIGVGAGGLEAGQRAALSGCRCLVAAERYRGLVDELKAEFFPITPLDRAIETMARRREQGDIGVVVGGDPLFFGIGRRLLTHFAPEQLEFRPAPTSVQLACSRFGLPWDDAELLSLHGRNAGAPLPCGSYGTSGPSGHTHHGGRDATTQMGRGKQGEQDRSGRLNPGGTADRLASARLAARLLAVPKSILLTDPHWTPGRIATILQTTLDEVGAHGSAASLRLMVAENLGAPDERLISGGLDEIAGQHFAPLNVMIILKGKLGSDPKTAIFGLREGEIAHQRGMITKDEVRAISLHKLALPAHGVLWDIGAASGSISLEAVRITPGLVACAVEKEEQRLADLKANIVNFATFAVLPVAGTAPAVLSGLPDPDRIFIGGSGGCLAEIIAVGRERLPVGGRMVINGVTAATKEQAPRLLQAAGLQVEIVEVAVRRLSTEGQTRNFNPITVITGTK